MIDLTPKPAVQVSVTSDGGHSVEFWALRCTEKIINVGENAHPAIIEQARAFKEQIAQTVAAYMKNAIKSDRSTLCAELEKNGQSDMAEILRRL